MSIVKSVMMVMANIDGNNNKFWTAEIHDDYSVHVRNGRIGSEGQTQPIKRFGSLGQAESFFESKKNEKAKKGYTIFEGITQNSTDVKVVQKDSLSALASREIRTLSSKELIAQFIDKLAKANIHNILQHTDLKYDEGSGLFKTPVGFVTRDTLTEARKILIDIGEYVSKDDYDNADLKVLVNRYLMLIPQKVGSKLTIRSVFPSQDSLTNHNSILDGLESSIEQLEDLAKKVPEADDTIASIVKPTFNCEITLVTDNKVIDEIKRMYDATRKTMHAAHVLNVSRVFEVTIDSMETGFQEHGKKLGNIQRLWHGTRVGNILSILKSGLFIPPSNASYVCGRMFGNGLYFSDQSTKSLNYAYGYWDGGRRDSTCYMFLFDVAMGKSHTPRGPSSALPVPGSDSTFAEANRSGVQNNEMIVYDPRQAAPRYLVEFSV